MFGLEHLADRKGYYVLRNVDAERYTLRKLDQQGNVTDQVALDNVTGCHAEEFLCDSPDVNYGAVDESVETVGDSFFR